MSGTGNNDYTDSIMSLDRDLDPIGDAAIISQEPDAMGKAAEQMSTSKYVESVYYDSDSVTVFYSGSGMHTWHKVEPPPPEESAGYVPSGVAGGVMDLRGTGSITNKKAIIANVLSLESSYDSELADLKEIAGKLTGCGYSVTTLSGADVTVEKLKGLAGYGIVIYNSHGALSNETNKPQSSYTEIQTGQSQSTGATATFKEDFNERRVTFFSSSGGDFYGVTNKFFETYADTFPNALFYNACCEGMKKSGSGNLPMAESLNKKGVSAYLGWTESQSISIESAKSLFSYLADKKNLKDAMASLKPELKQVINSDGKTATLQYYPDSASKVTIYD